MCGRIEPLESLNSLQRNRPDYLIVFFVHCWKRRQITFSIVAYQAGILTNVSKELCKHLESYDRFDMKETDDGPENRYRYYRGKITPMVIAGSEIMTMLYISN